MDGRDIGTVVFPDAQLKIYMQADARVRARRRYLELLQMNPENKKHYTEELLMKEIVARDESDRTRRVGPLRCAPDAHTIDSSHMTQQQVVDAIIALVEELIKREY